MKIKLLAVIYSIIMLLVYLLIIHFFDSGLWKRDMVYYNEQLKILEGELAAADSTAELEEKYSCSILFLSDDNYKIRLNRLLKDGAVILDYYKDGDIIGKVAWNDEKEHYKKMRNDLFRNATVTWAVLLICGYAILLIVYIYIIYPFKRLQKFSSHIAKGNFNFPLPVTKNNFFGAFTESFDIMREELKRAKEGEYEANRSKKELIAELSHDIKTPVSTIKATCEVMQLKEHDEDTLSKIGIIASKAEIVDNLVSNMFNATLDELEVLTVDAGEESSLCIVDMINELKFFDDIIIENEMPGCLVYIDKVRFSQVIDNIINNSYKYAGTAAHVSFTENDDAVCIRMADRGKGVPEEELAFITEKFYRGSNTSGKAGSGLGLYLSKMFMERMEGGIECYNDNGFVVEVFVRKV